MATTRAQAVANVRNLLNDLNKSRYVVPTNRIVQVMKMEFARLGDITGFGEYQWDNAPGVAVSSGTYDYFLNHVGTGEAVTIGAVVYAKKPATTNELTPLERVTMGQMDDLRAGSQTAGESTHYAVYESDFTVDSPDRIERTLRIRIWPTPGATQQTNADKINVFLAQRNIDVLTTDAAVVYLPSVMIRALEKSTAAMCVDALSDADLKLLRVNRDVTKRWDRDIDSTVAAEQERRAKMRVPGKLIPEGEQ
ncbi:MAG TPA: hypothetical protein VJ787_04710 [Thermoleophilia bacterium]|nr:hypothetical protein [Thermoleophilia bacterium]